MIQHSFGVALGNSNNYWPFSGDDRALESESSANEERKQDSISPIGQSVPQESSNTPERNKDVESILMDLLCLLENGQQKEQRIVSKYHHVDNL